MHGATVLRVCRALLGPADADDAWSETFLAAMRAYPDLPADANVEAWLVTIAHRKAIDVTPRHGPPGDTDGAGARRTGRAASPRGPTRTSRTPWPGCPPNSARPSPTTTSPGCRTPSVAAIVGGSTDAARRAAADGIATLRRTYPPVTARKGEPR